MAAWILNVSYGKIKVHPERLVSQGHMGKERRPYNQPQPPSQRQDPNTGEITVYQRSRFEVKLTAAQKAQKAAELRVQRYGWKYIAEQVGYASAGAACRAVHKYVENLPKEPAKQLREMELEGLDLAEQSLAPRIAKGDTTAIDAMLKIKAQRAKLTGLYDLPITEQENEALARVQLAMDIAKIMRTHPEMPIAQVISEVTNR